MRGREVMMMAGLAATTIASGACSTENSPESQAVPTTATVPEITTSSTTVVTPEVNSTNPYDVASEAVYAAYHDSDFEQADQLVITIADPSIRTQVDHAIDVAEAEEAAWLERQRDDHTGADAMIARIQDPELAQQARDAVALDRHADILYEQTPRDLSAWSVAYNASLSAWSDLYTKAGSEWSALFEQSTVGQQPLPDFYAQCRDMAGSIIQSCAVEQALDAASRDSYNGSYLWSNQLTDPALVELVDHSEADAAIRAVGENSYNRADLFAHQIDSPTEQHRVDEAELSQAQRMAEQGEYNLCQIWSYKVDAEDLQAQLPDCFEAVG